MGAAGDNFTSPRRARCTRIRTEQVFGLDMVAEATLDEIVEVMVDRPGPMGPSVVVTPNVDHIVRYSRDPQTAAVARGASLVLPDGAPIVWASRALRRPVRRRLTGSDLFPILWRRLAAEDRPVVVVVPNSHVAAGLLGQHPRAVPLVAPESAGDPDHLDQLCEQVARSVETAGATHVLVAIGFPTTHRIAAELATRRLSACDVWVVLVGAGPEFHLGLKRRAPHWMQRIGLEWVHRLASEPRRLWRRYLLSGPQFAAIVWREHTRRQR